jgi:probable DNA repair protein
MSISLFDITGYRTHLIRGTLIITPNRRIRAKMLQSYGQAMIVEGHRTWDTPNVHSLEGWVRQQYETAIYQKTDLVDGHCVLTADQETSIWEQVVQTAQAESGILNHRAAAEQAAKAYKTLALWQEPVINEVFHETTATEAFAIWVQHFESICKLMNVTPAARVPQIVLEGYQQGILPKESEIILVGFDDVPPVYESIFATGTDQIERQEVAPVPDGKTSVVPAMDERDEIRLSAMWAQSMVVRDPNATIGVIVPDLGQRRDEVHRTFASILDPNHLRVDVNNYAPVFNISAGEPLYSMPLMVAAMDILSLNRPELATGTVQRLMMSPLIGGGVHESEIRAKVWRTVAQRKDKVVRRETLLADIGKAGTLKAVLNAAIAAIASPETVKLPSQWAADIADQLSAAGWPGDGALNSVEYQVVKAFHRVLHEMAGNDAVLESVSLSKALKVLNRLVKNTPFQPETKDSPVQVLGALEGAGLNFDYVWIMGMRDDKWPAAPSPSPFIPIHLQRARNMPNASPERELQFTRSLTNRYSTAGKQVIFSYPLNDKENEVTPSSMITMYPEVERTAIVEHFLPAHEFWAPARGVSSMTAEEQAVPFVGPEGRMNGGVGLFKDYFLCPFRGFARHRLRVQELEAPEEGVDHAVRGQLSHLMMYNVWDTLKDHASLISAMEDPEQFEALLRGCAESTVEGWERSSHLSSRVQALEVSRLVTMALSWLQIDAARSPFRIVEMEADAVVDVHGVKIKIKRDRVDEIFGKGIAVIDYKENAPSLSGWNPDTMHEPQVPIGALTLDNPGEVVAVAFGALNRDKQALKGFATDPDVSPSMEVQSPAAFSDVKEKWDEALKGVSAKILAGNVDIDPVSENVACAKCELRAVCRNGLKSSIAA